MQLQLPDTPAAGPGIVAGVSGTGGFHSSGGCKCLCAMDLTVQTQSLTHAQESGSPF